ncbi:MAG: hypothetical protein AAFR45_02790 [Pseudomonadota bacterium]
MDLDHLHHLMQLKARRSDQELARIAAREAHLRAELSRLRTLAMETYAQSAQDAPLRAIGADVVWLKWLSSSQKRLGAELAQTLARKDAHMAKHKRAYGTRDVSRALADAHHDERARQRMNQQLSATLSGVFIKRDTQ